MTESGELNQDNGSGAAPSSSPDEIVTVEPRPPSDSKLFSPSSSRLGEDKNNNEDGEVSEDDDKNDRTMTMKDPSPLCSQPLPHHHNHHHRGHHVTAITGYEKKPPVAPSATSSAVVIVASSASPTAVAARGFLSSSPSSSSSTTAGSSVVTTCSGALKVRPSAAMAPSYSHQPQQHSMINASSTSNAITTVKVGAGFACNGDARPFPPTPAIDCVEQLQRMILILDSRGKRSASEPPPPSHPHQPPRPRSSLPKEDSDVGEENDTSQKSLETKEKDSNVATTTMTTTTNTTPKLPVLQVVFFSGGEEAKINNGGDAKNKQTRI